MAGVLCVACTLTGCSNHKNSPEVEEPKGITKVIQEIKEVFTPADDVQERVIMFDDVLDKNAKKSQQEIEDVLGVKPNE